MRRSVVAAPAALLLSLAVAGTALGAFCGVDSKPDGAGQKVVILVDLVTGHETIISGANASGRLPGGFADVYLDFDGSGTVSAGDCLISDTFLISSHSGRAAPGQFLDGLAVNPAITRGLDPGGADAGVGEADLINCPF